MTAQLESLLAEHVPGHSLPRDFYTEDAIYRLDRRLSEETHPPLPLRREGTIEPGAGVTIIGHPSGVPTKVSQGTVVELPEERSYFVHDADTLPGSSGSLVLGSQTGIVEGIHVFGDRRQSFGAPQAPGRVSTASPMRGFGSTTARRRRDDRSLATSA